MKKQEAAINVLERFLPPNTFALIAPYFKEHTIHLTLTRERKSVLGDYRNPTREIPQHRISLNINLNPYSFLITLVHELAHMLTFIQYKHSVSPHGGEWKTQFSKMLMPFIGKHMFPPDVEKALVSYIQNPAASTCTDPRLFKALYRYDERKPGYKLVDDVPIGRQFEIEDGRIFEKMEQLRTRSRCRDIHNKKIYFFPGIVEVKELEENRRIA